MFSSKLRSWMEAVRPRKKHNRKEKQQKNTNTNDEVPAPPNSIISTKLQHKKYVDQEPELRNPSSRAPFKGPTCSRYSAANLSSPESAYSTGYSTDGTSPGLPPDGFNGMKAKLEARVIQENPVPVQSSLVPPDIARPSLNTTMGEMASPRQRNRIRTNPWLSSASNTSHLQRISVKPPGVTESPHHINATNQRIIMSPLNRRKSLSSSSCSSLSGAGSYWEASEDDCTLNEMMGKYDESYIYEKETDILSDSDPTDFDTDIDTGQDGGDEDETQEGELDYIDDGSLAESGIIEHGRNSGHCVYFNYQSQRRLSRRRTSRKPRNRSSSHKKRQKVMETEVPKRHLVDGSRSVGATPLFSRRSRQLPVSKLAVDDKLRKRSNSVHVYRDSISSIDRKDKEAGRKYEELIVKAEHILRSIKTEGLSPRRAPVPPNKRVELLRSAECPKVRLGEVPSNNFMSPRFGSKKVHLQCRSPLAVRSNLDSRPVHRSPKHKRKTSKAREIPYSSSSEDEGPRLRVPPQSEPVRRKVYGVSKTVMFHPSCNVPSKIGHSSSENLRQQVLLNTISNLKRSLEDQSASLKQAYRSSQHIPLCL